MRPDGYESPMSPLFVEFGIKSFEISKIIYVLFRVIGCPIEWLNDVGKFEILLKLCLNLIFWENEFCNSCFFGKLCG